MARALGPERLPQLAVTGLDPNPEMQSFCRQNAATAGLAPGQLRLVEGGAEAMPFEDGEFDAAVITLVRGAPPGVGYSCMPARNAVWRRAGASDRRDLDAAAVILERAVNGARP